MVARHHVLYQMLAMPKVRMRTVVDDVDVQRSIATGFGVTVTKRFHRTVCWSQREDNVVCRTKICDLSLSKLAEFEQPEVISTTASE